MCGSRLETPHKSVKATSPPKHETRPEGGGQPRPSSSILGLNSEPPPRRPAQSRPAITGPSFLGLGTEPDPAGSYLLDDEEPRSHRGLWIMLVLLVAVALAGLQFRATVRARAGQLYAAVFEGVNPHPPAPPVPAPSPAPADSAATAPAAAEPQAAQPKPNDGGVPAANEVSAAPAKPGPAATEDASREETGQEAEHDHASRQRPTPAKAVSPENDPLLQLARKYIQGQGVRRDCVTGLAYLREAMKRPNAAAVSQMGALYATGTCVPLDRVAAYRHFTSALQMSPSNSWLARERDELYGQMTSAERRQADRQ